MYPFQAWNGNFAILIFLQNFDYTRDYKVAKKYTLPLLEGLNSWWHCYLNRTIDESAKDGYVYNDQNSFRQDMEGEDSQIYHNPSGSLSMIERSLYFHLMLCRLIEIECPEYVKDMYEHLPPYNIVQGVDGYNVFSGWKQSLPETDGGPYSGNYYIWPSENLNFFSPHLMDNNNNDPNSLLHISRATLEGSINEIDWLRINAVDFFTSFAKTRGGIKYVKQPQDLLNGFDIFINHFFGENFLCFASGDDYNKGGFNGGVGTTETIGMMNAVNEVLLSSTPTVEKPYLKPKHKLAEFFVEVFPYWPLDEYASYSNLLAKGGHLISAAYNNITRRVEEPVKITAKYSAHEYNSRDNRISILNPWISQGIDAKMIKVNCGKRKESRKIDIHAGKILSFDTYVNQECLMTVKNIIF